MWVARARRMAVAFARMPAAGFSYRRCSLVVTGIGMLQGFRSGSRAGATVDDGACCRAVLS